MLKHLYRVPLFRVCCALLLLLSAPQAQAQALVGHWVFEPGLEKKDLAGNFSDLSLQGATVSGGELILKPNAWAQATGYKGLPLAEKTLIAWVRLDALQVTPDGLSGGSALTLEDSTTREFDAIVFGEKQPKRWMAGSDSFKRSKNLEPGFGETATGALVQVAMTWQNASGSARVKVYRNGAPIGEYTQGPLRTFSANPATSVLFGKRHTATAPNNPFWLSGRIAEARIYDRALTQAQVQAVQPYFVSKFDGSLSPDYWYVILNKSTDARLGMMVTDSREVRMAPVPETGNYDRFLWRLIPNHENPSVFRVINKALGADFGLDSSQAQPTLGPFGNYSGQYWFFKKMGKPSDLYTMSNAFIGEGKRLNVAAGQIQVVPAGTASTQGWTFTAMELLPGKSLPTPSPAAAPYDKQLKAAGLVDIYGTPSASPWALLSVQNMVENMLLAIQPKYDIQRLKGQKIIVINAADVPNADKYPFLKDAPGEPGWINKYRGGAHPGVQLTLTTEEMMCRSGTSRPGDTAPRRFDHLTHEFGHILEGLLQKKPGLACTGAFFASDLSECWAYRVQGWFDNQSTAPQISANRAAMKQKEAAQYTYMSEYFDPANTWAPTCLRKRD
jgi:hypothetical protein